MDGEIILYNITQDYFNSTDSTSHQKQVSNFIWKKNRKTIAFKLNVAIFPYLMQESLISDRAGKKYTDPTLIRNVSITRR